MKGIKKEEEKEGEEEGGGREEEGREKADAHNCLWINLVGYKANQKASL